MSKQAHKSGEQPERLRPRLHRALGRFGWKVPETDQEVRAAEAWTAKSPVRLPDRLREVPDMGRTQESGRLLDRYLRDDTGRDSVEEHKPKDEGRSGRDLDR